MPNFISQPAENDNLQNVKRMTVCRVASGRKANALHGCAPGEGRAITTANWCDFGSLRGSKTALCSSGQAVTAGPSQHQHLRKGRT
jgi:hypothetical protein